MKKILLFAFALVLSAGPAPAQSITITSPAAEDGWAVGSPHDIVWAVRGTMDDEVKILLFQGGSRVLEIAGRAPNSGRYSWLIPASVSPGRYTVRVRTMDSAESDNSEEFLIVPASPAPTPPSPGPIAVVEPNGGESIRVDDVFRITWHAVTSGAGDRTVDLLLIRDGRPVGVIAENIPVLDRSYLWKAGHLLAGSAPADVKYKVRIRVDGTTIQDDSDKSFALVASAARCDFGVDGVTFGDGSPLENGITVPPAAERRDVEGVFLVKVRWNKVRPPVAGGRHFIRTEAVLTGAGLGGAPATPSRFSEEDADASGIITIRYPFRLVWADIPRMTRDRHVPVEFSIAFSAGDFDSDPVNNSRTLEMRVIGLQATPDFVAEIVPGSVRVHVRNALNSTEYDILDFWSKVRFKNLARNDAGGPAAPYPNVTWYSRVLYLGNDGRWHQVGYNMGQVTVPGDDWLVIDVNRANQNSLWVGVNAVPVNQWKPMRFEITINYGDDIPETNRDNNSDELEFELPR